jgi:hypothetical protein
VNVQNGNEIRLTSGDGVTVSGLSLSTVSTGSPVTISNSFKSGTIPTGAVGTYTLLNMQIGSTDIIDFDISTMDSTTLEAFAKELKTNMSESRAALWINLFRLWQHRDSHFCLTVAISQLAIFHLMLHHMG